MHKIMRTAAMAAAMFVAGSTVAVAPRGGGRGRGRGPNVRAVLKDSLHVSEAVAAKADSIVKAFAAENAPLMEAARGGDADARTKMTENRAKQTAAIKALLTEEQKEAYDKLMPAGGRRGGGGTR